MSVDDESWSPLHVAASWGNLQDARNFLDAGNHVDVQNIAGQTPLHIAAQHGMLEVARLLLEEANAAVDARTNDGMTPFYAALHNSQLDVARLLLSRGADVNAQTENGNSALHMATERGLPQVAAMAVSSKSLLLLLGILLLYVYNQTILLLLH